MKSIALIGCALLPALTLFAAPAAATPPKPNIVLILADDLGFGDTGCYGATKIPTPNVDRLGREGLRFTDAHATSATCTPSRYALLTGQYPWRKPGTGVLPGNAPLIIDPNHATLASILKHGGYRTGIVGKWHLGLGVWGGGGGLIGMATSSRDRMNWGLITASSWRRRGTVCRVCT